MTTFRVSDMQKKLDAYAVFKITHDHREDISILFIS